jgi:hypothetical protein
MPEATETEQAEQTEVTETPSGDETPESPPEGDTFPREYVERLRKENAGYRDKAKRADDLAERLHLARVIATGRLADPTDLPYDESLIDDDDAALSAAIDGLLERKPHLASRRVVGDIGQGAGEPTTDVDLGGMLRSRA